MASHEGSRKRQKLSDTDERPSMTTRASHLVRAPKINAPSTAAPETRNENGPSAPSCEHETALETFRTDLDAMRQLITCKICDRFLYEPYSLACGHTYCYSCLSQWLASGNHKKTCPDCRSSVTQSPSPSFVIREMVLVFISRDGMLPEGETADQHQQWAREEAELLARDKAKADGRDGGLFNGHFKRGDRRALHPIHDPGDGVDRCPVCHWELERGWCNHCSIHIPGPDDSDWSDYSDSMSGNELDHEIDLEDAEAVWGVGFSDLEEGEDQDEEDNGERDDYEDSVGSVRNRPIVSIRRRPGAHLPRRREGASVRVRSRGHNLSSEEDDEEAESHDDDDNDEEEEEDDENEDSDDDDEHDPTMDHFIVNDTSPRAAASNGDSDGDDSEDTAVEESPRRVRGRSRWTGTVAPTAGWGTPPHRRRAVEVRVSSSPNSDDSEDEDTGPVLRTRGTARGIRRRPAGRTARAVVISDGSSDEEIAAEGQHEPNDPIVIDGAIGNNSPEAHPDATSGTDYDESIATFDDDDDGASAEDEGPEEDEQHLYPAQDDEQYFYRDAEDQPADDGALQHYTEGAEIEDADDWGQNGWGSPLNDEYH